MMALVAVVCLIKVGVADLLELEEMTFQVYSSQVDDEVADVVVAFQVA